jgi:hypothetical protein
MIDYAPLDFDALMLAAQDPITFLRFGDGDWITTLEDPSYALQLLGGVPHASVLLDILNQIRTGLQTVRGPLFGMQGHVNTLPIAPAAEAWIAQNCPDIRWVDADALHMGNLDGRLREFVNFVNDRNLVLVGPPSINRTPHVKPIERIESGGPDDYFDYRRLRDRVLAAQAKHGTVFVCFSGFLLARAIGMEIYREFSGKSWFIDCGTIWDPHCGDLTRGYHFKMPASALLGLS